MMAEAEAARRRLAPVVRRPLAIVDGLRRRARGMRRPGDPRPTRTSPASSTSARSSGAPRAVRSSTCAGPRGSSRRSRRPARSGWAPGSLHLERFAAKETEAPAGGERSFELVLASSGVTLTVPPDRSVFDVIQDAGHQRPGLVPRGICGTCEQLVLEGQVDHRDSVLNEAEQAANDAMMVCVSRCRSDRLVLDL